MFNIPMYGQNNVGFSVGSQPVPARSAKNQRPDPDRQDFYFGLYPRNNLQNPANQNCRTQALRMQKGPEHSPRKLTREYLFGNDNRARRDHTYNTRRTVRNLRYHYHDFS